MRVVHGHPTYVLLILLSVPRMWLQAPHYSIYSSELKSILAKLLDVSEARKKLQERPGKGLPKSF